MKSGLYVFIAAGLIGTTILNGCGVTSDTASTETTSNASTDAEESVYWDASYTFQEGGTENSAKWVFCPDGTLESVNLDCSYRIEESDGERWLTFYAPSGDAATSSYRISDNDGELNLTADQSEDQEAWRLQFSSGTDGLSAGTEWFDGTYVHPDYPDYETVFGADATVKSTLYETYTVNDNVLCITGVTGEEEYEYTFDEASGTLTLEQIPADGGEASDITLYKYVADHVSEDSVAGKTYAYEGESFSGLEDDPFTILFEENGTYTYSESLLSSYMGAGDWSIAGDVLTMTENVEATGNPSIQYFRIADDSIIYLGTYSSNFSLTHVEDGECFTCSE
ncbi:MAG: hypothetical protein LUD01_04255 [Clostridiales bacterium]|nr:hypothetical protein [Clostridiales bacterium]